MILVNIKCPLFFLTSYFFLMHILICSSRSLSLAWLVCDAQMLLLEPSFFWLLQWSFMFVGHSFITDHFKEINLTGCSIEILAVFKRGRGASTKKKKSGKKQKRPHWITEQKKKSMLKLIFNWSKLQGTEQEKGAAPVLEFFRRHKSIPHVGVVWGREKNSWFHV